MEVPCSSGTLALDLLLGDVHSLKEKRSVVRPIVAELRTRFEVSAAEAGHLELHRRALVGVAVVAPDRAHCVEVLDAASGWSPAAPRSSCCRPGTVSTREEDAVTAHDARARKLADRIQVIVAEMLEGKVKDPRLGFVTITDTRVTNDLREATVFYTVYGSDEERAGTAAALESAKGVLRSEVGRQTGVRHTPSLAFVADAVPGERQAHRGPARRGQGRRRPGRTRSPPVRSTPARPTPTARRARTTKPTRRTERDVTGGRTPAPSGLVVVDKPAGLDLARRRGADAPAGRAPAGSGTPARSTRWRPACCSSGSSGRPSCSATWRSPTRPTSRRSGSGRRRSPTTPRAR